MEKKENKFDGFYIYILIGFCFSVAFYITVGSILSIEYIVSFALVVIGATWSYLAIEVSQVKQLRDEHIEKVSEAEKNSWKLIKESTDIVSDMIYFKNAKKTIDPIISGRGISDKINHFRITYNAFYYNIMKLRKDKFDIVKLSNLHDASLNLVNFLIDKNRVVFSSDKLLSEEDEKEMSNLQTKLMEIMVDCFNGNVFSFEDFSENYKNKKNMCVFVVSICVFSVLIKGFVEAFDK